MQSAIAEHDLRCSSRFARGEEPIRWLDRTFPKIQKEASFPEALIVYIAMQPIKNMSYLVVASDYCQRQRCVTEAHEFGISFLIQQQIKHLTCFLHIDTEVSLYTRTICPTLHTFSPSRPAHGRRLIDATSVTYTAIIFSVTQ
jgi:hypothetical protein